jgi:hypothetical protein
MSAPSFCNLKHLIFALDSINKYSGGGAQHPGERGAGFFGNWRKSVVIGLIKADSDPNVRLFTFFAIVPLS